MSDWWKGAVIYQIYPRSFRDSDNNGVGDLNGIKEKLDYVANLGVDGIWLSPFYTSPMRDFGYDVADYYDVDPIFGTLADFDALLERAHELGLKVIIDQVYSHTSDRHPWFEQSRFSRTGEKSDWYIWADPKPDGTPPNNWLSVFGGPAWSWDTRRRQYYMHNFLAQQPDLNFHNPEVQDAILDVSRFWLDRGVDGFRLDVVNYYFHDPELRDNPPNGSADRIRPYQFQSHRGNRSRPETLEFVTRLRQVVDSYHDRMCVAEIASDKPIARSMEYTQGTEYLHTAYNFRFLNSDYISADLVRSTLNSWDNPNAWPSWSFSNHDVPRALTRWDGENHDPAFAKVLLALLCSLRGTAFIYQGEELGLPQGAVPFDRLQDPEAILFWPETLGRDGCRTPMPWQSRLHHAGFSTVEPWLPVDPRHWPLAVDAQEIDQASVLHFTRNMLALRKQHAALRDGEIAFHDTPEPVVVFERRRHEETILCGFNLSKTPVELDLPALKGRSLETGTGLDATLTGTTVALPAYGGFFARL